MPDIPGNEFETMSHGSCCNLQIGIGELFAGKAQGRGQLAKYPRHSCIEWQHDKSRENSLFNVAQVPITMLSKKRAFEQFCHAHGTGELLFALNAP